MILFFSGIYLGDNANGASYINNMLYEACILEEEHFLCYPEGDEFIVKTSTVELRFKNIKDIFLNLGTKVDKVIQCHSWYPDVCYYGRLYGAKTILLLHSIKRESLSVEREISTTLRLNIDTKKEEWKLSCEKRSIQYSDLIICVSNSEKKLLRNHYDRESTVIYNPLIDVNIDDEIGDLLSEENRKVVFCIGRLDIRKPLHTIMEYFKEKNDQYKLLVAGYTNKQSDNKQHRHAEAFRKILNYNSSNIHFLGKLSKGEVKYLMMNSHITIAPSMYDSFSLSTAECLMYSKNPVVSKYYGPLELTSIFKRGKTIDFLDYNEISLAIEQATLNNSQLKIPSSIPDELAYRRWVEKWKKVIMVK